MIRIPVISYCIFVALWFSVYLVWPDRWWPFILLNKLAFFFLIAAAPIFFVSLMTRNVRIIGLAFVPIAIFAYFYMPFFLPHTTADSREPNLRIMTYNIWNQNKDLDSLLKVISTVEPDVLAVQEIMDDVLREFVDRLSREFPYHRVSSMVYGGTTALFSKYELSNVREINFNIDRPAIVADIEQDNKRIRIIGAHLYPSYYAYHNRPVAEIPRAIEQYIEGQQFQVQRLVRLIRESGDLPVVLACDCNIQRTSSSRNLLENVLSDSAVTMGWQRGNLPVGAESERDIDHIDYLWYRGDIRPVGLYRTKNSGGSDHSPVFADFIL